MKPAQTSIDAYHQKQPKIQSQIEQLKDHFRRYPYIHFTDRDLQLWSGWAMTVVWSRRNKLREDGFIIEEGERVNPETKCRAKTYRWKP